MPSDKLFEQKSEQPIKKEDLIKVFVKEFSFDGNKKYPTSELQKLVQDKVNKELVYADLRNILQEVSFIIDQRVFSNSLFVRTRY